jgi:hypothetical protein
MRRKAILAAASTVVVIAATGLRLGGIRFSPLISRRRVIRG